MKETAYVPNSYGDRFIPRRYTNHQKETFSIKHIVEAMPKDILKLKQIKNYWRIHNLSHALNYVFHVDKTKKTLNFTDISTKLINHTNSKSVQRTESFYKNLGEFDWPCRPRLKPGSFIESTHDLPPVLVSDNRICWSNKGVIAASFGPQDLVLWAPPSNGTTVFSLPTLRVLAFHPNGDILLTITKTFEMLQLIKIWNVGLERLITVCGKEIKTKSHITCGTWHTNQDLIFLGTQAGEIIVYKYYMLRKKLCVQETIKSQQLRLIMNIRCSVNGTYIAAADFRGMVIVYKFGAMGIEEHVIFEGVGGVPSFAWHPWNENLMVLGE